MTNAEKKEVKRRSSKKKGDDPFVVFSFSSYAKRNRY